MFDLRAKAIVSEASLVHNFRKILECSEKRQMIAMVKADAYGHGASWVSKVLCSQKGLSGFGVATIAEAIEVRKSLKREHSRLPIIVFSGTTPWGQASVGDQIGEVCLKYHLTPVISSIEDWRIFNKSTSHQSWSRRVPFELKFNTGMNRLGLRMEDLREIRRDLSILSREGKFPSGVFSHFSVGEDRSHHLTVLQKKQFNIIVRELSPILPSSVDFHLQNSAAIWSHRKGELTAIAQRVRPGLALYGVPPQGVNRSMGLKTVLNLEAPVIKVHRLSIGDFVGYGARYRVPRPQTVAILAIGYADGIHRVWCNSASKAKVLIFGRPQRFLGPISMDLCAVSAPSRVRRGQWARLWGEGIEPWQQAAEANTIPYEVLTSLTRRVERIYV